MKKKLIAALIAIGLVLGLGAPALALTTQDVTITFTANVIALTNSVSTWTAGSVDVATVYWWTNDGNAPAEPFVDGNMKSTITNTGNIAEDIDVHGHNSTGGAGMTIATNDTPGANAFSLRAGITGMANAAAMVQVITTDTELKDNLAASGTVLWCMRLKLGAATVTDAQTTTATLTARAHS